ncbi:MAG: YceD family protein [Pseudomonadota bacterium]
MKKSRGRASSERAAEGPSIDAPLSSAAAPFSRPTPVARLKPAAGALRIDERANKDERAAAAALLDLQSLGELAVEGTLAPYRRGGWRFEGTVRARYAQTCVVTLDPAPGRLHESVERIWLPAGELAALAALEAAREGFEAGVVDAEEGEEPELLPDILDLAEAAFETLALSLDPYPRAPGAALDQAAAAPPGAEPIAPERPFAALAGLKAELESATDPAPSGESEGESEGAGAGGRKSAREVEGEPDGADPAPGSEKGSEKGSAKGLANAGPTDEEPS